MNLADNTRSLILINLEKMSDCTNQLIDKDNRDEASPRSLRNGIRSCFAFSSSCYLLMLPVLNLQDLTLKLSIARFRLLSKNWINCALNDELKRKSSRSWSHLRSSNNTVINVLLGIWFYC